MEKNISDELQEAFETGRWKVRKFALPNATKYIWDIDNITWAETGLIDAFGANRSQVSDLDFKPFEHTL